ncbi:MAG: trypsin-like serine protease [Desulfobulbaceae bacterium]|nr:trypsin-like serine protease [Desulfobulbaceae bacterium]
MRCPKCDHEQKVSLECEACGIIFDKYRKFQERKKADEEVVEHKKKSGLVSKIAQLGLLIIAVAGTTYYFTAIHPLQNQGSENVESQVSEPSVTTTVSQEKASVQPQLTAKSSEQSTVSAPISTQDAIERARNATVSIETPWGTGSGFFIDSSYIVTNRHVVEFDERKIADFRSEVERDRRMIELEKQKIRDMKNQMRKLAKGPTKSQLSIIIKSREKTLAKILPQHDAREQKLEELETKVQPSDIKIILADGTEHVATYLMVSNNYDLALMSLFAGEWTPIQRPRSGRKMHQGDKVYAIGSPVGLRHTVTSGIFSGYRKHTGDGQMYLQTDAAINPGNSGGPLIDENGCVRGVNRMIIRDTEGIGFAIPIEIVFEEFSSSLF